MSNTLDNFFQSVDPAIFDSPYPTSKRADEDKSWVIGNREKLTRFEGKWIAVYGKKVIASGKNGLDVQKRALKKLKRDVPDLYIRFLERSHSIY